MAQVLIREVDPGVVDKLKQRAKKRGRSLEAELRLMLEREADLPDVDYVAEAAQIKSLFGDRVFPDSAELIREDRDC